MAPSEPELLADHRVDEVRVRVRQEVPFRPARPEARAEPAARAHRDQALDQLVAVALAVGPRVEPRVEEPRRAGTSPRRSAASRSRAPHRRRSRGTAGARRPRTASRGPSRTGSASCRGRAARARASPPLRRSARAGRRAAAARRADSTCCVTIAAATATSPSFASSEGWTVTGPRSIHLDAPYSEVPEDGCAAISISTIAPSRTGRPATFHTLGRSRATTQRGHDPDDRVEHLALEVPEAVPAVPLGRGDRACGQHHHEPDHREEARGRGEQREVQSRARRFAVRRRCGARSAEAVAGAASPASQSRRARGRGSLGAAVAFDVRSAIGGHLPGQRPRGGREAVAALRVAT